MKDSHSSSNKGENERQENGGVGGLDRGERGKDRIYRKAYGE